MFIREFEHVVCIVSWHVLCIMFILMWTELGVELVVVRYIGRHLFASIHSRHTHPLFANLFNNIPTLFVTSP